VVKWQKISAVAACVALLVGGVPASASASSAYSERVAAWSECRTFERLGPFWGRVALGGNNPTKFPPCGPKPGSKYAGPAFPRR
jgi:hypothetical protein